MLVPTLPGWKIETVGDDICWMHVGSDGRLWAINPEAGMFGVAPGTSEKTNPDAMRALTARRHLHERRATARTKTPWWEGLGEIRARALTDWRGQPWREGSQEPAAHPNSRFTVPLAECPSVGPGMHDPARRSDFGHHLRRRARGTLPAGYQAFDWRTASTWGTLASETTAAATGTVGMLRNDPMAMLPFCGYNMADYFAHWLAIGSGSRPPRIFHVNWFRRDAVGKFLWPGFRRERRVLKWVTERVDGACEAEHTPIGFLPRERDLDLAGSGVPRGDVAKLLDVDREEWLREATRTETFLTKIGPGLPASLRAEHEGLLRRRHG